MKGTIEERKATWDEFLARWQLDDLPNLTLDEYSQPGEQDGFVYWLEKRTENLGSIWGGSSFKFGVYRRKDKSPKTNERGRCFDDTYGWQAKYGATPQEAFERVRNEIVKTAQASRAGELDKVDSADLGDAVKWKLAFLYQNRDKPCVVPVFKTAYLQIAANSQVTKVSSLQQLLMAGRGSKDVQAYGDEIWDGVRSKITATLSVKQARQYIESSGLFVPIKPPTKKMAGYQASDGLQIALALDNLTPTLYLEYGAWFDVVKSLLQKPAMVQANHSRSSNLEANAPRLWVGHEIIRTAVLTMETLIALCEAYCEGQDADAQAQVTPMNKSNNVTPALNQILYGPPGTGKTYATIDAALAILDPEFLAQLAMPIAQDEQSARRQALKTRFDQLLDARRIRFVTFHQSFCYEDFVEGLRDKANNDNQIEYHVEDGIFKQLCDAARTYATRQTQPEIGENPRIWKISIDGTGLTPTHKYCVEHGEARIGWGNTGDLGEPSNDYFNSLGSNDRSTLGAFAAEIAEGDILVCIHSATEIGSVGVVRGPYRFEQQPPSGVRPDYKHVLSVDWLYPDVKVSILPLNDNKRFTLKTVYPLDRFSWADLLTHLEKAGSIPVSGKSSMSKSNEPHVLIIDEINRGNVSRIFGELITLIEPSKRAGQPEALSVQLPYSKRQFNVPDNLYIVGTMNTADRSLSGLDIALRRRFDFVEMLPQPDLLDDVSVDGISVGNILRIMNQRIELLLDRDHCLGHAYFFPLTDSPTLDTLAAIFKNNVIPLLQEYFFEDWQRIQWVLNDHRKPLAERFLRESPTNFDSLFGEEVNVNDKGMRWEINEEAFNNLASYKGIVTSGGTFTE